MKTLSHPRVNQRGILTSSYKQEILSNVHAMHTQTLHGLKNRIKRNSASNSCVLTTSLKVSMFFIAMIAIVL